MNITKQINTNPETDIIQKIISGNSDLFEVLIRIHNSLLYKTGRSYGYSHEDTEDLMQETFINAYVNLSKFENRSSFKTWIIRIMLNNCFQKQHKFSFKNEIPSENAINENSIPMYSNNEQKDANKVIANRELSRIIEGSLQQIPLDYRMVFTLREMNGLNVAETAEALNITESNVKVRLYRAKAMLRNEIKKIYVADEIFEFNLIYCDSIVNKVMNKIITLDKNLN